MAGGEQGTSEASPVLTAAPHRDGPLVPKRTRWRRCMGGGLETSRVGLPLWKRDDRREPGGRGLDQSHSRKCLARPVGSLE